jgi:hypothetical protein
MLRSALVAAALVVAAGCGSSDRGASAEVPRATPTASAEAPRQNPSVRHARCAADAANCAAVTGRVIYVEAVDPDGDGDAHYVLAGGSVTAPGISVIDIEKALRPDRLARAGDLVSAAGPVYTGSHGQHQIQAVELHQQRRR